MDKDTVDEVLAGKVQLVDVRTDIEWSNGHAEPAKHVHLHSLMGNQQPDIDISKPVLTYCQSGHRAKMAARILKHKGYDARSVGSLSDWQKAGGKVTSN